MTTIATTTACGNFLTLKGIITIVTIKEEDVFCDCRKDDDDAAAGQAAMPLATLTVVAFAENMQGTSRR